MLWIFKIGCDLYGRNVSWYSRGDTLLGSRGTGNLPRIHRPGWQEQMADVMRGKTNGSSHYDKRLWFPNSGRVLPCVLHLFPLEVHHDRDNTQVEFHVSNPDQTDRQDTYVGQWPDTTADQSENCQGKEKVVALLFLQKTIKYLHELHNGNDHMF